MIDSLDLKTKRVTADGNGFEVFSAQTDILINTTKTFICEFASILSGQIKFTVYRTTSGEGSGSSNSPHKLLLVDEDGKETEMDFAWYLTSGSASTNSCTLTVESGKKYTIYFTCASISGTYYVGRYSFSGAVVDATNPIALNF